MIVVVISIINYDYKLSSHANVSCFTNISRKIDA